MVTRAPHEIIRIFTYQSVPMFHCSCGYIHGPQPFTADDEYDYLDDWDLS